MAEPTFSVIVPAYNAPVTIRHTINSILAQSRRDFELIVVDDGSTDETAEIAEGFEDPRVTVHRQANKGVAGARNTGISLAGGRFLSFLDNDDLWLPNYLEVMETTLSANPEAGLAYTDGWTFEDATKRIRHQSAMSTADPPRVPPADIDAFLLRMIQRNFILSSVTLRSDVVAEIGGFDESVNGVDDYELWLRILIAGHSAVRTPQSLVLQRDRSDSQSKDRLFMLVAWREVLARVTANERVSSAGRRSAAGQVKSLSREISALNGESKTMAAAFGARRRLGVVRRKLRGGPKTFDHPPAEIAAAFPNLGEL